MEVSIAQAIISLLAASFIYVILKIIHSQFISSSNPLARNAKKPTRKPYVTDQKLRDKVVKQNFSIDKVREWNTRSIIS